MMEKVGHLSYWNFIFINVDTILEVELGFRIHKYNISAFQSLYLIAKQVK